MIDPHFYRYWSFWKRVLLFAAGTAVRSARKAKNAAE